MLVDGLLAALFFAHKVGHLLHIDSTSRDNGQARTCRVVGQVFFSSSSRFVDAFDFKEALNRVTIGLSHAHFRDITAVAALDKMVPGRNEASATIVDRFAMHDKPDAIDTLMEH